MSAKFAVLLGLVVIDSTNKAIRFREGSTTETVNVAEGVYFVRGNGGSTDLLAAVCTALAANTNATNPNTYAGTIAFDTDYNNTTAETTIERATGSSSFSLLWADALTTFDPALLGFTEENSAHDGNDKVSTLSPSSLWTSSNIVRRLEPMPEFERTLEVSRGDVARAVERLNRRGRLWVQDLIHAQRMKEEFNAADPSAAFERFVARHADGKRFEFHEADLASGTVLEEIDAVADGTRVGTFIFDDDFYPRRAQPFAARRDDSPLYSFAGYLVKYHEEDEVEVVPVPGALFVFDPDDASTLTITASPQIDQADNAIADIPGSTRYLIEDAGLIAADGMNLVAGATPSGADAARSQLGVSTAQYGYFGLRADFGGGPVAGSGYWWTGANGSIPTLTRFTAVKITAATASGTPHDNGNDWIWCGGVGTDAYLGLSVRDDGGTYKLGIQVRDSVSLKSIEVAITLDVWMVVVARYGGGFLDFSIDGGVTWQTPVAVTGSIPNFANQYLAANHFSGRSFSGLVRRMDDYPDDLSNADVLQQGEYISVLVNG